MFTSHDHERLIHRTKPGHDNATPSGNGVAARALIALGHLAAEPRYVEAGERTLRLFAPALARAPAGYAILLGALDDALTPPPIVLLDGDARDLRANGSARSSERCGRRCASSTSRTRSCRAALAKGPARPPARSRGSATGRNACRPAPILPSVERALARPP